MLGSHYGSRRNCPDLPDLILAFLIMRFYETNGWSSLRQDYASGRLHTYSSQGLRWNFASLAWSTTSCGAWGVIWPARSEMASIVGRQRAGRFPIWESSVGYRNARSGSRPCPCRFRRSGGTARGCPLACKSGFYERWALRRFQMLPARTRVVGRPTRRLTNDRRRRRHGSERDSRYDLVNFLRP